MIIADSVNPGPDGGDKKNKVKENEKEIERARL
jgi:hypothetical protein